MIGLSVGESGSPGGRGDARRVVRGAGGLGRGAWVALVVACLSAACGVIYPELSPPVRSVPAGAQLDPPPPADLYFIAVKGAQIPERTRDGRKWDSLGGSAPDPYLVLKLEGRELLRTPVQSNTLNPTWPGQKRANYRVPRGSRLMVELWDSNPVNNHPICVKKLSSLEGAYQGELNFECPSGARVSLQVEPAHAKLGLGLYYELRTKRIFVTRVLEESPARRAGLVKGQEIVTIQDRPVAELEEGAPQSLINANATTGVKLTLRAPAGDELQVTLKNGPIYPVVGESVGID